jgi:hypothetical protein
MKNIGFNSLSMKFSLLIYYHTDLPSPNATPTPYAAAAGIPPINIAYRPLQYHLDCTIKLLLNPKINKKNTVRIADTNTYMSFHSSF